jgi:hypothetical protein
VIDLLRFLHILATSVWLGATLWVPGDVRRTLGVGRAQTTTLQARVSPALWLDIAAGAATILFGVLLIAARGGVPRIGIVIGFALALARLAVVAVALRPAWRSVQSRLVAGEDVAANDGSVKRMAMWSGIGHTLWVAALATMVFPV